MNAIVTVIGKDKVGIIAAVCIKLAEMNVNVLDISQTILDGKFTMVMAVDAANANVGFEELAAQLRELGEEDGAVHPHPAGRNFRRHAQNIRRENDAESKRDPLHHRT